MLLLAASLLASDSSAMRCSRFFIFESIALMVCRESKQHGGKSQQTGSDTYIYPPLIDIQILMNHGAQQHFFHPIGNRILCCSEILLESIKVLPESSTVNVR